MYSVVARVAVTLTMVAAGTATSAGAQQARPTEADLVRRIDSLLTAMPDPREYERQAALAKAARGEEWERRVGVTDVPMSTVPVGPFSVLAPPDQMEEATELYRRAWSRYASSVGDASPLLDDSGVGPSIY